MKSANYSLIKALSREFCEVGHGLMKFLLTFSFNDLIQIDPCFS